MDGTPYCQGWLGSAWLCYWNCSNPEDIVMEKPLDEMKTSWIYMRMEWPYRLVPSKFDRDGASSRVFSGRDCKESALGVEVMSNWPSSIMKAHWHS